ncbi:MAG: hypothetical protein HEP70_19210 [Rhodobiaceae bacterium]|uniref:Plasmid replication protein RepC_soli-1b n=1 Tax=Phaeobacter piscinae TaxID=1580596 RepID=A0ABM6PJM7_9RHOB|nr:MULTISPECIES: replication initiation protein RepC [Rhodobacterales]ATG37951.1 plasmid replication protein RepC_soli-1b [Phaeobacter piscinae]AUQ88472.1 plasmid replication protein RepC_soli-1b [Phaeobacter piscinae]MCE8000979.1 hypothetical protein [Rhodobiaceae bacterium]
MNYSPQIALPQGMSRRDVIAVISEIGPDLNLSGAAIYVLTKLIGSTSDKDWTEPGATPTFYGTQETMAERLHLTARQLRNHERNLERKQILIRDTKANGAREAGTGRGLLFTPLKAHFVELLALRDEKRAVTKRIKELKSLRSVRLRRMKDGIARLSPDALDNESVAAILARFDAWPRSDRLHSLGLDHLEEHVEAAAALCIEFEEVLQNLPESSCEPEETFRSFIQEDNKKNHSVSCNADVDERSAGKPAHWNLLRSEPDGPDKCLENKCEGETGVINPQLEALFKPEQLFKLASPDFQRALHMRSNQVTKEAMIDAAHDMLAVLGINYSAWATACNVMGRLGATLCVLVLDANRDHPQTPVRNPGGVLRGMIRAHKREKLNLVGSVIGLQRRRGY